MLFFTGKQKKRYILDKYKREAQEMPHKTRDEWRI